MAKHLKVLAVHGVGRHRVDGAWRTAWRDAIEQSLFRVDPNVELEIDFPTYDDLFDAHEITLAGTLEAVAKLGASGVVHGADDIVGSIFERRARGARGLGDRIRWTAGMVVQWAENETLRAQCRDRLQKSIEDFAPDVVCAHSLGSLIAYDTFSNSRTGFLLRDRTFISLGSQIGNPFVRSRFGGRIAALECEFWYHLYNREDAVFTAPISIPTRADGAKSNFEQVDCFFDIDGFADHDATAYLSHRNVSDVVWSDLLAPAEGRREIRATRAMVHRRGRHERRALLIGINDYPDPRMRLEGCVNDVYLMSQVLQESGFEAEGIRVVLNNRATAAAIRERLEWLLDGVQAGDERILYYSGHGAQIDDYGADETVDRVDECLVPWDFDWSAERAVTDDWFFEFYSQLPYDTRFLAIFDCCHSGGLSRSGMGRPRGLTPPDDIRHRRLFWDSEQQVWHERQLTTPNEDLLRDGRTDYLGRNGSTRRLGRAVSLRRLNDRAYDEEREQRGHAGPYLPVIMQACAEQELAYEYLHGNVAYGAFTYSLTQELREADWAKTSFHDLVAKIGERLRRLEYEQTPALIGPETVLSGPLK